MELWILTRRDALLLALWILGTCVFAALLNWTTNGRSILPLVPAAAIEWMATQVVKPTKAEGFYSVRVVRYP